MEIKKVWSVNCLLCWKTKWRRCPSWVRGWSCVDVLVVWGLWSLLNTEGILTLLVFLLSDGSLIQIYISYVGWHIIVYGILFFAGNWNRLLCTKSDISFYGRWHVILCRIFWGHAKVAWIFFTMASESFWNCLTCCSCKSKMYVGQ